jgi:hypothetical protein
MSLKFKYYAKQALLLLCVFCPQGYTIQGTNILNIYPKYKIYYFDIKAVFQSTGPSFKSYPKSGQFIVLVLSGSFYACLKLVH